MTGRDLIIYILQNHLEDEIVYKDGSLLGFMTIEEAAVKLKMGVETVKAWVNLGHIASLEIDNKIYVSFIVKPPMGQKGDD